jgi:hypothetical protein
MGLPGIYGDPHGLIHRVCDIRDCYDRRRAGEEKGQMAFAMRMGAHRLVQPVHGYPAKRPMTDRQRGTHATPPNVQVIVFLD